MVVDLDYPIAIMNTIYLCDDPEMSRFRCVITTIRATFLSKLYPVAVVCLYRFEIPINLCISTRLGREVQPGVFIIAPPPHPHRYHCHGANYRCVADRKMRKQTTVTSKAAKRDRVKI